MTAPTPIRIATTRAERTADRRRRARLQVASPAPAAAALPVLDDVSLTLHEGEIVALLGKSGSGKSTLLRTIAGLIAPTAGTVRYRGARLNGANPGVGMVFQSFALMPWLTVQDNVELGLQARGVPRDERRQRALDAIDLIGLDGFESAYPKELSGGMRQRVGFARALVLQPDALLMDEPFSALDVLTAENLRTELMGLWAQPDFPTKAICIVTHNIEEAVLLADRVLVLGANPGHIKAEVPSTCPAPATGAAPPSTRSSTSSTASSPAATSGAADRAGRAARPADPPAAGRHRRRAGRPGRDRLRPRRADRPARPRRRAVLRGRRPAAARRRRRHARPARGRRRAGLPHRHRPRLVHRRHPDQQADLRRPRRRPRPAGAHHRQGPGEQRRRRPCATTSSATCSAAASPPTTPNDSSTSPSTGAATASCSTTTPTPANSSSPRSTPPSGRKTRTSREA